MKKTKNPWLALIPMLLAFFMIMVDTTIVNIAIPTLIKHFNTDLTTVMWVNSAYMLATAVPLLLAGRLGDRFGQEKLFLIGTFVFTASSAWCGLSRSVHELIIARIVQGLGAAMMTPQTMAMISKIFPPQDRGKALGYWGAVAGVATMFGPIIGGFLVDGPGWEWIFFVNVPFGILALIMAVKYIPNFEGTTAKFDILGVILSGIGLFCLVFAIQESHNYNWGTIWGPFTVWNLIGIGIIFLVLFVLQQKRMGPDALMPLRLFSSKNFDLANVCGFCSSAVMVMFSLPFTIYLQSALGMDPKKAALVLLPMSIATGIAAPLVGKISNIIQPRFIVAAGFAIFGLGMIIMLQFIKPAGNLLPISLASLIAGFGLGGVFAPVTNIVTQSSPRELIGAGSGAYNTLRQFGGVIGSAVVATLLASNSAKYLDQAAIAQEGSLPEQVRGPILEGIKKAAADGEQPSSMNMTPPPGMPETVITQIKDTVSSIVKTGLSNATNHTLMAIFVPIVIGIVACLLMNNLKLVRRDKPKEVPSEA